MAVFICIDGVDGAGKSTQLKLLHQWFADMGRKAVLTREPGGTPAGEAIRAILVDKSSLLEPDTEMLLFCADRTEHQMKVHRLLAEGVDVLCDRFLSSTWAYQIFGRGLPSDLLEAVTERTVQRLPDLTVILDMDASAAVSRSLARLRAEGKESGEGRFEAEDEAFYAGVRKGFRWYAEQERFGRCALLDASCEEDELFEKIKNEVMKVI